jgi:quercetin dioxygenase-like cupin family protein
MSQDRPANPNRYIIENDAEGNSFFTTALPASLEVGSSLGGGHQRLAYQTEQSPALLSNNTDLEHYKSALQTQVPLVTPGGGANVWYNDIPPGAESSPMHRTVSFDIVILLQGEVELTLSNNETRILKPSDMVIQRSTLHKWRNASKTQWARMVAIVSECLPYVTEKGEALGAYFPSDK